MFDGKRFFPDTGMPIWKIERISIRLAVWLPDPLTVATWMVKSLTARCRAGTAADSWLTRSVEDMVAVSSWWMGAGRRPGWLGSDYN